MMQIVVQSPGADCADPLSARVWLQPDPVETLTDLEDLSPTNATWKAIANHR
jgi:hypothetical protein